MNVLFHQFAVKMVNVPIKLDHLNVNVMKDFMAIVVKIVNKF